jgi:hypothetical protein
MAEMSGGLARECRAFCRYLVHQEPSDYVIGWYQAGHRSIPFGRGPGPDRFDRILLTMACQGGPLTRIADAYARVLRPRSALRQKLVLLLAIVENCPPAHGYLNSAQVGSKAGLLLVMAAAGGGFLGALLIGMLLVGPVHLGCALLPPDHRPADSTHA